MSKWGEKEMNKGCREGGKHKSTSHFVKEEKQSQKAAS